ncbi:Crp/Fnr family transcriptional regulator [Candidatus Ferrigenium straubiae]|jgi:CRP-like cAMP-binding protein|uniref:Crp/Fnr family transcriptional regulator n=1 Tax=Candidatus Ferrigenium straubiae TaxID=2919506 RepID=UPI003F4ABF62
MSKILAQPAYREHKQNNLLAGLPAAVYERLAPDMELVPLRFGSILYEDEAQLRHVYFPTDSVITLLRRMEDGLPAEIAVIGNEGLVGIATFMGGPSISGRAVVQSAGCAYRLDSSALKWEFELGGALRNVLLHYTQSLIKMMAQTAACNRYHSVEQQLCRWLLSSMDRLPSNELLMTQDLIANMPGLRREGIAEAARKLHAAGIVNYTCGRIVVLDRPKLEAQACGCYMVVKREFERLLSAQRPQAVAARIPARPVSSALSHGMWWRPASIPRKN